MDKADKRFLRIILPIGFVLVTVTALLLFRLPHIKTKLAWVYINKGDGQRAAALLNDVSGEEANTLRQQALYLQAETLFRQGDTEKARTLYSQLRGYEDAGEKMEACDYAMALRLFENEDYSQALLAFSQLNGYKDSLAYIRQCWDILYPKEELPAAEGEAELWKQRFTLANRGHLAAGFAFSLGIDTTGRALFAGDNSQRQGNIAAWERLVSVSAGAYHSLGLQDNGKVLAAGDNSYGQCLVEDWDNVVAISAGYYDSFALTQEGTVLHTGFHSYEGLDNWKDIAYIAAGGYGLCAITRDGLLLATHASARAGELMDLAAVSMENGYSVGITKQGELLGHNVTLEPMNRIVAVLAGSTRVLALDVQGKVYEFPFMERDSLALEGIQGVQAMAQSATHALLLFNDGTVMATGENGKGQCEVDGWQISSAE